MNPKHTRPHLLAAACLFALGIAPICIAKSPTTKKQLNFEQTSEWIRLNLEIHKLQLNKTCVGDSDCHLLPFGARSCGGPKKYIAYSSRVTDSKLIEGKVERLNELEYQEVMRGGTISTCLAVTKPEIACINGRCITSSSAPKSF